MANPQFSRAAPAWDVESDLPPQAWSELARVPGKREHFLGDVSFRLSLADARSVHDQHLADVLRHHAVLLIKAEAVLSGRSREVANFLTRHGFAPIWWRPVSFSPCMARELWRYSWDEATLVRIHLAEMLSLLTPALVVLLRDSEGGAIPGTVRLCGLKGQAKRHLQTGDTLRAAAGALNQVLSYVHVSDEPADIVREFGVLLSCADRCDAYRAMVNLASTPEDFVRALGSLEGMSGQISTVTPITSLDGDQPIPMADCSSVARLLSEAPTVQTKLDLISVLSQSLPLDRPGISPALDGGPQKYWGL